MNPEKQRIAIATACGWTRFNSATHKGAIQYGQPPNDRSNSWELPNYLNDLNAMHKAKKVLTDDQAWEMVKIIVDYCQSENGFPLLDRSESLKLHSATAEREAEAFLKVLGLWEEAE